MALELLTKHVEGTDLKTLLSGMCSGKEITFEEVHDGLNKLEEGVSVGQIAVTNLYKDLGLKNEDVINVDALAEKIKNFKPHFTTAKRDKAVAVFNNMDKDGSGSVSLEELKTVLVKNRAYNEGSMAEFDHDSDGTVTQAEMIEFMHDFSRYSAGDSYFTVVDMFFS